VIEDVYLIILFIALRTVTTMLLRFYYDFYYDTTIYYDLLRFTTIYYDSYYDSYYDFYYNFLLRFKWRYCHGGTRLCYSTCMHYVVLQVDAGELHYSLLS
jgi:hypothetical protein